MFRFYTETQHNSDPDGFKSNVIDVSSPASTFRDVCVCSFCQETWIMLLWSVGLFALPQLLEGDGL